MRLRLHVALEVAGGAFELRLHLGELGGFHLAADVRLHLRDVALEATEQVAERAGHFRQFLGADDDERHHPDHQHLGEREVAHGEGGAGAVSYTHLTLPPIYAA